MLSHLRQSANLLRCIQPVASAASNSFAEASLIVQLTDRLRLANADCNIASQRAAQGDIGQPLRQFSSSAVANEEAAAVGPPSNDITTGGGQEPVIEARDSYHGAGRAGASLRRIPMSPKKVSHFVALLRRKHVDDALAQCQLHPKKAAQICYKVIKSAVANAEFNHGLDASKLAIDIINVGRGNPAPRRPWVCGRGKMGSRLRYQSHLEIILKESSLKPKQRYLPPLLERPRKHFNA